jgi:hypothetical protein
MGAAAAWLLIRQRAVAAVNSLHIGSSSPFDYPSPTEKERKKESKKLYHVCKASCMPPVHVAAYIRNSCVYTRSAILHTYLAR